MLDAEEQIEEAGKQRRLAGLVRSVDDMQVGLVRCHRTEVEAALGKLAVPHQVEFAQPHQREPSPALP
ncbi:hypothetical protein D3C86_2058170 [compost metagenome]